MLGYICSYFGCPCNVWHFSREESSSSSLACLVTFILILFFSLLFFIVRYILEVITFVAVVVISVVYTQTFFLMPLLIKTIFTTVTWLKVRNIYKNSFGSFYTRNTNSVLKISPVFCVHPLRKV